MNKIAIVGHPASGYSEVESLLRQCGMGDAHPSRRESLRPEEITETLCRAHGAAELDAATSEDDFRPIDAGPVWHGMALDLMLANLDQPLWGWADPRMIHTLDYWVTLDPRLTFVLVYDEPQRALTEAAAAGPAASQQDIRHLLDNWTAYNGALLRFFLRNPGRCLLVHAQQVRRAMDDWLQQLQPRLDVPLSRENLRALTLPGPFDDADEPEPSLDVVAVSEESKSEPGQPDLTAIVTATGMDAEEVKLALNAPELERHLADLVLSEHPASLQLYAELQSVASLPLGRRPGGGGTETAWSALVRQRTFAAMLISRLHAIYQRASDQARHAHAEAEDLRAHHERTLSKLDQRANELSNENELLLTQLHEVQEELERIFHGKRALEEQAAQQARELERKAEQMARQAAETQARLEAEKAGASKLLEQESKTRKSQADRLAELQRELEAAKKAHANAVANLKAAGERENRAKELGEENELLLNQLHHVQEELERYYLEAQELKAKTAKPTAPEYYGAGQRIQQQLTYKLGAAMIEHSRSVGGWLGMPFALVGVTRQHRRDLPQRKAQKLPPIHKYRDAHEADRYRNHLSYRLGDALLRNIRSPIGWVRLPLALRREVRDFRQRRQGSQPPATP